MLPKPTEIDYSDENRLQDCVLWYKALASFSAKLSELLPEHKNTIDLSEKKLLEVVLDGRDYLSLEMIAFRSFLDQIWPLSLIQKVCL
jgi:hypothetical protein